MEHISVAGGRLCVYEAPDNGSNRQAAKRSMRCCGCPIYQLALQPTAAHTYASQRPSATQASSSSTSSSEDALQPQAACCLAVRHALGITGFTVQTKATHQDQATRTAVQPAWHIAAAGCVMDLCWNPFLPSELLYACSSGSVFLLDTGKAHAASAVAASSAQPAALAAAAQRKSSAAEWRTAAVGSAVAADKGATAPPPALGDAEAEAADPSVQAVKVVANLSDNIACSESRLKLAVAGGARRLFLACGARLLTAFVRPLHSLDCTACT